jgi:hypothetical protein
LAFYAREAAIVPGVDTWIATLFDDEHLDSTCEALAAVSDLEPEDGARRVVDLRRQLTECDMKLARYRQLLEQDANITVVAVGSRRSSGCASGSSVTIAASHPPASSRKPRSRPSFASSKTSLCPPLRARTTRFREFRGQIDDRTFVIP